MAIFDELSQADDTNESVVLRFSVLAARSVVDHDSSDRRDRFMTEALPSCRSLAASAGSL